MGSGSYVVDFKHIDGFQGMITFASEFFSVKRRAKRLVNRQLSHLLYKALSHSTCHANSVFFISEKYSVQYDFDWPALHSLFARSSHHLRRSPHSVCATPKS